MRFDPFALPVLAVAAISFFRAVQGHCTGTAHWYVLPGQGLSADKEDDPLGYSTALWGNIVVGGFALFLAGWLLLH